MGYIIFFCKIQPFGCVHWLKSEQNTLAILDSTWALVSRMLHTSLSKVAKVIRIQLCEV